MLSEEDKKRIEEIKSSLDINEGHLVYWRSDIEVMFRAIDEEKRKLSELFREYDDEERYSDMLSEDNNRLRGIIFELHCQQRAGQIAGHGCWAWVGSDPDKPNRKLYLHANACDECVKYAEVNDLVKK